MVRYDLSFYGRSVSALGLSRCCHVTVEADNPSEAAWRAYETHGHILGGVDGVVVVPASADQDDPRRAR